jgi:hypothetical protein
MRAPHLHAKTVNLLELVGKIARRLRQDETYEVLWHGRIPRQGQ